MEVSVLSLGYPQIITDWWFGTLGKIIPIDDKLTIYWEWFIFFHIYIYIYWYSYPKHSQTMINKIFHTHTHIYIYIYMYVCICIDVYWECYHPNWRIHIFRRVSTRYNQIKSLDRTLVPEDVVAPCDLNRTDVGCWKSTEKARRQTWDGDWCIAYGWILILISFFF